MRSILTLIHMINRQSCHWSMDLHAPVRSLMLVSAVLVAATGIAMATARRAR